jgi:hypothetical protein
LLLFGMMGFGLIALSVVASIVLLVMHAGVRSIWLLIETVLVLGSILFATGILGEQIAGQRAQLREIRRQLDELTAARIRDR